MVSTATTVIPCSTPNTNITLLAGGAGQPSTGGPNSHFITQPGPTQTHHNFLPTTEAQVSPYFPNAGLLQAAQIDGDTSYCNEVSGSTSLLLANGGQPTLFNTLGTSGHVFLKKSWLIFFSFHFWWHCSPAAPNFASRGCLLLWWRRRYASSSTDRTRRSWWRFLSSHSTVSQH
jgi:hypothetical protein